MLILLHEKVFNFVEVKDIFVAEVLLFYCLALVLGLAVGELRKCTVCLGAPCAPETNNLTVQRIKAYTCERACSLCVGRRVYVDVRTTALRAPSTKHRPPGTRYS